MFRKKQNGGSTPDPLGEQLQKLQYEFVDQLKDLAIGTKLEDNKKIIEHLFKDCSDAVIRSFTIEPDIPALAVLIDGLAKTDAVNDTMKSLMVFEGGARLIDTLVASSLPVSQTSTAKNYKELLIGVLGGDTAILVEGNEEAILCGIRGAEKRSVNEPETESVIRGPKEGFIESIRTNTALIRRKLKTPHLKMKPMIIGRHSNTNIVVSYIEGLTEPALIEEVEKRLGKIDIDAILESGYIEEFIQDNSYSPFPQVQYTERPDTVVAALLQGRIAILTDGTPHALLVPFVFAEAMQASEDYYERFQIATLIRWLRYLFLVVSLTTPALYVAITTFHQELLPTTLLLSIAAARESIPFPAVVEALIMEITFEALREAGIRLPKTVGSAVSILGALVVGQAAVQAGIVSAPMVIIVSITGIASFTIPRYNGAIAVRMLRFPIMIAASLFGMYGIMLSMIAILAHMANLRSFGVPYLSPSAPLSVSDLRDVLVRTPWWTMSDRPHFMPVGDFDRLGNDLVDTIQKHGGQTGETIKHRDKSGDGGKPDEGSSPKPE